MEGGGCPWRRKCFHGPLYWTQVVVSERPGFVFPSHTIRSRSCLLLHAPLPAWRNSESVAAADVAAGVTLRCGVLYCQWRTNYTEYGSYWQADSRLVSWYRRFHYRIQARPRCLFLSCGRPTHRPLFSKITINIILLTSPRAYSAVLPWSTPARALPTSTDDARCHIHIIVLDSITFVVDEVLEFRGSSYTVALFSE